MAARLADTPGVAEQASLVFAFDTYIKAHGKSAHTAVEGRDPSQDAAVDQPLVTSGTWVRPGGAVLERGFAKALGVGVGDHVTVSGRDYPVVGTAISAATSVYPWSDNAQGPGTSDFGGRMWLTSADTRRASSDDPGVHLIYLKLNDPTAAQHWMATAFAGWSEADDWVNTHGWQDVLQTDKAMIRNIQPALGVGGRLLAVAAIVPLASLATARAARDNRRAALLKAVGAGPATVTAALLAQHLLLTLLATAIGLTSGTLAAPFLVDPSAGLLNTGGRQNEGLSGSVRSSDQHLQRLYQARRVLLAERGEKLAFRRLAGVLRIGPRPSAPLCQLNDVAAAVLLTAAPLHQPFALQRVDERDHRRTVHAQPPRGLQLRQRAVCRQHREHRQLPRVQPERGQCGPGVLGQLQLRVLEQVAQPRAQQFLDRGPVVVILRHPKILTGA
ncbi:hypothetical protein QF027_009776 [Streptomyces canus]|nr:hypothetical protein [Streptomyces canus]